MQDCSFSICIVVYVIFNSRNDCMFDTCRIQKKFVRFSPIFLSFIDFLFFASYIYDCERGTADKRI